MVKKNNKQATVDGLLACGYVEQVGRSKKYRCFKFEDERTVLVGKSGAFRRCNHSDRIDKSVSLTGFPAHLAFIYIGQICDSCELSAEQFRGIRKRFVESKGVGFGVYK